MNNEEQVNDHIEEDYNFDDIVEDDSANTLIHDTFNLKMDDDDDVHDLPLLDKAYKPLYEGSNTSLLSVILLIMNLKVMNGLSNKSVTQMLRYVIYSITYIYDHDKGYLCSSNNFIVNS